jgi:hypothetical protein
MLPVIFPAKAADRQGLPTIQPLSFLIHEKDFVPFAA